MWTTTKTMVLIAMTMATGAAAQTVEPLRCDARLMRAESQRYDCLARCDRRGDRAEARPDGRRTAEEIAGTCEAHCDQRFADTVARLESRPPCALDTQPASPPECEARMLRVSAADYQCRARCGARAGRKGFDAASCLAACATRCGTSEDELNAHPVCGQGRIASGPVCAAN